MAAMNCAYCGAPLRWTDRVKYERFCCRQHQLAFPDLQNAAIDRLHESGTPAETELLPPVADHRSVERPGPVDVTLSAVSPARPLSRLSSEPPSAMPPRHYAVLSSPLEIEPGRPTLPSCPTADHVVRLSVSDLVPARSPDPTPSSSSAPAPPTLLPGGRGPGPALAGMGPISISASPGPAWPACPSVVRGIRPPIADPPPARSPDPTPPSSPSIQTLPQRGALRSSLAGAGPIMKSPDPTRTSRPPAVHGVRPLAADPPPARSLAPRTLLRGGTPRHRMAAADPIIAVPRMDPGQAWEPPAPGDALAASAAPTQLPAASRALPEPRLEPHRSPAGPAPLCPEPSMPAPGSRVPAAEPLPDPALRPVPDSTPAKILNDPVLRPAPLLSAMSARAAGASPELAALVPSRLPFPSSPSPESLRLPRLDATPEEETLDPDRIAESAPPIVLTPMSLPPLPQDFPCLPTLIPEPCPFPAVGSQA